MKVINLYITINLLLFDLIFPKLVFGIKTEEAEQSQQIQDVLNNQTDSFLPNEMILEILKHASPYSLKNFASTSTKMRNLAFEVLSKRIAKKTVSLPDSPELDFIKSLYPGYPGPLSIKDLQLLAETMITENFRKIDYCFISALKEVTNNAEEHRILTAYLPQLAASMKTMLYGKDHIKTFIEMFLECFKSSKEYYKDIKQRTNPLEFIAAVTEYGPLLFCDEMRGSDRKDIIRAFLGSDYEAEDLPQVIETLIQNRHKLEKISNKTTADGLLKTLIQQSWKAEKIKAYLTEMEIHAQEFLDPNHGFALHHKLSLIIKADWPLEKFSSIAQTIKKTIPKLVAKLGAEDHGTRYIDTLIAFGGYDIENYAKFLDKSLSPIRKLVKFIKPKKLTEKTPKTRIEHSFDDYNLIMTTVQDDNPPLDVLDGEEYKIWQIYCRSLCIAAQYKNGYKVIRALAKLIEPYQENWDAHERFKYTYKALENVKCIKIPLPYLKKSAENIALLFSDDMSGEDKATIVSAALESNFYPEDVKAHFEVVSAASQQLITQYGQDIKKPTLLIASILRAGWKTENILPFITHLTKNTPENLAGFSKLEIMSDLIRFAKNRDDIPELLTTYLEVLPSIIYEEMSPYSKQQFAKNLLTSANTRQDTVEFMRAMAVHVPATAKRPDLYGISSHSIAGQIMKAKWPLDQFEEKINELYSRAYEGKWNSFGTVMDFIANE